jgi:hypothetical protein
VVRGCSGPSDDAHVAPVNQSRDEILDRKVGVGPRDTSPQVLFPLPPIEVDQSVITKLQPATDIAVKAWRLKHTHGVSVSITEREFSERFGMEFGHRMRREFMIWHGG